MLQTVEKPLVNIKMGCRALLALLVLHRAKLLASNQSVLALGVAPMRVVSRWCRCVVQRLCATDCKRPCLVRAAAPHSAPSRGEWVFGKDAEIRTHQALHEAKPSECPKGDRDSKLEVYFKNRLFLQTELRTNKVRSFFSVKNQIPSCIINSCDEGKLHRRQKALTAVFI